MRLFFAIEITEDIRAKAADLERQLVALFPSRAYRWTKPELFHVTMAFLGNVEESLLSKVETAAQEVISSFAATDLSFKGLNCFSSPRRPKVLWIPGVEQKEPVLESVGMQLYKACSTIIEMKNEEKVIPHITLARAKGHADRGLFKSVSSAMTSFAQTECGQMPVTSISLMESNLNGQGPRYRTLSRFSFKS